MSSIRRVQSSRVNGARSNGPVTKEGKEISSRNSLRHGLLAGAIVLDGESQERFLDLLVALTAEFNPATESEWAMLESMAVARWRQMRTWTIQKADFDREMHRQAAIESPALRAAIVFRNLADTSRSLDLLQRYETTYDRQFTKALTKLLYLQSMRGDHTPDAPVSAATGTFLGPDDLPNEPSPKTEHHT